MFLPKAVERLITPHKLPGKIMLALGFGAFIIGTAFMLRAYTISHLTLWTQAPNATAIAILPEDGFMMDHRMADILNLNQVKDQMQSSKRYVVYFIPRDYIMQGMIADTGGDWKLFEQHRSMAMITDWVFHPFRHLREGHHAAHTGMHPANDTQGNAVIRRLIFLSIEDVDATSPSDLFAINALRVPQFMVDIDVHTLKVLDLKELPHGSGWGTVPTPMF
jgi:hypothetical protein